LDRLANWPRCSATTPRRVAAYRKLRDDLGTTEQSMFDIEAEPVPAGDGAYQES